MLLAILSRPAAAESPQRPELNPGNEVLIQAECEGIAESHFMLYLPADFNDSADWPSIFFYRGQGESLSTGFFQQITQSRGFVIAAMEYVPIENKEMTRDQYLDYLKAELKNTAVVRRYIEKGLHIKLDPKRTFLAGISKGGWLVSELFESRPGMWSGAIIIAAGRREIAGSAVNDRFKNKRIYIGAGEKDPNLKAAQKARDFYQQAGADVTFEEYEGLGHAADPNSAPLRKWLFSNTATAETEKSPE